MLAVPLAVSASSAALTVTVRAMSQPSTGNTKEAGLTVMSLSPPEATAIVKATSAAGRESSTTV